MIDFDKLHEPDKDGLPPHEPSDLVAVEYRSNHQQVSCLFGPTEPERVVDIYGPCDSCGEEAIIGQRTLTDAEFADAWKQYRKDKAEWDLRGGQDFVAAGPAQKSATVTAADGSYRYEYGGDGDGPWKLMAYEHAQDAKKPADHK